MIIYVIIYGAMISIGAARLNQFEILCGDFKYDLLETKNRNYTKKIIDSYFTPYMPYLRQNPPLNQSAIESQP
jgi:hypothetical protein